MLAVLGLNLTQNSKLVDFKCIGNVYDKNMEVSILILLCHESSLRKFGLYMHDELRTRGA
jgi:hypothetical protein